MVESGGVPDPDNVPGHIVNGQLLDIVNVEKTEKGNNKNTRKIGEVVSLKKSLFCIIRFSVFGMREKR